MNSIEKAIERSENANPAAIWRSRLLLVAFVGGFVVLGLIVFLSDASSFDLQDPPNEKLVTLAEQNNATFETWASDDEQITFTFSIRIRPAMADMTTDAIAVDIAAQAEALGLSTLRITHVARTSASFKVSGYVDLDD